MHLPVILGQGVFLIGFVLVALARPGAQSRAAIRRRCSAGDALAAESVARIPLDRLPDSSSLAGVPIRILVSERSGPGAMLRDTLMIRPPTHGQ